MTGFRVPARRGRGLLTAAVIILAPLGLAVIAVVAWLLLSRVDAAPFVETLDSLAVPANWEAVHTEAVDGDFLIQARATRYYFVDADAADLVSIAKDVARSIGFAIPTRYSSSDWCDRNLSDEAVPQCPRKEIPDCKSNGGLPFDCVVFAARGLESGQKRVESLSISMGRRGESFSVGTGSDRRSFKAPDRTLVTISASLEWRTWYLPASSPPATNR